MIKSNLEDVITNRYDFVYFFDITDGNPNGDPDSGNLPRIDPETGQGLVTDVCIKRKIRNFVSIIHDGIPPYEIYVKERAILNKQHDRAWQNVEPGAEAGDKKKLPKDEIKARALTKWMCANFYDIRTFGAVMTTEVNCGQVRGPIQLGLSRSLHPVITQDITITRCSVTSQKESDKQEGGNRTMGRKSIVPYGLYRVHGYINPNLAMGENGTGFSNRDLELFKQALNQMFEHDRSSSRANMRPVACIAFKHDSALGNARADILFAKVNCTPKAGIQALPGQHVASGCESPPRSFGDYSLTIDQDLPVGVSVEHWVEWS